MLQKKNGCNKVVPLQPFGGKNLVIDELTSKNDKNKTKKFRLIRLFV
jgi:hypothetical protein